MSNNLPKPAPVATEIIAKFQGKTYKQMQCFQLCMAMAKACGVCPTTYREVVDPTFGAIYPLDLLIIKGDGGEDDAFAHCAFVINDREMIHASKLTQSVVVHPIRAFAGRITGILRPTGELGR